jgi:hypothetical protein
MTTRTELEQDVLEAARRYANGQRETEQDDLEDLCRAVWALDEADEANEEQPAPEPKTVVRVWLARNGKLMQQHTTAVIRDGDTVYTTLMDGSGTQWTASATINAGGGA